jgi:hypothetical protein
MSGRMPKHVLEVENVSSPMEFWKLEKMKNYLDK